MTVRNQRFSLLKQPIASTLNEHLIDYPTPSNLSYWWGFGSLAGISLVIQLLTGIFLAMHYTPHVDLAFTSVEHIMRDVSGGWLLRYMHANGASMFFIVVYIHIFRGLYHGSYSSPREFVWCIGVLIFLLMIVTAFIGYVLPWGQMSFWGATVITSLASAIPVVGDSIVTWLWGGFSVDNATLNRFFSLHYLLPFILVGASIVHLAALHQYGSNNPLGVHSEMDKISFYPYFYVKDLVGWVAFGIFYALWVFYAPNVLGHPDNYIPANPMSTPPHIVPEWYFLPIYAILRSIPDKAGGVAAIAAVFICLLALPFLRTPSVRSSSFRPIYQGLFWLLLADRILLGWIGCQPVEAPFVTIGQISPVLFFVFLLLFGVMANSTRWDIHLFDGWRDYLSHRFTFLVTLIKADIKSICFVLFFFLFLLLCSTMRAPGGIPIYPFHILIQLCSVLFLFFHFSPRERVGLLFVLFCNVWSLLFLIGVNAWLLACFPLLFLFSLLLGDWSFYFLVGWCLLDSELVKFGLFLICQLLTLHALSSFRKDLGRPPRKLSLLIILFLIFIPLWSFSILKMQMHLVDLLDLVGYVSGGCIIFIRLSKGEDYKIPLWIIAFLTFLIGLGLGLQPAADKENILKVLAFIYLFAFFIYLFCSHFVENKNPPRQSLIIFFLFVNIVLIVISGQPTSPTWLQTRLVGFSLFLLLLEAFLILRQKE